ncbi:glycosyltransferase family 2 protein [Atopococcus tabaci]|uniref:glycosyltransferase family 2 protein n=1 Tax=Atopococcus tabaci TaxID=269774 RepID=UPI0003FA21C1|nr:glycosyltransferase family 2 protein [Atopococcus tabaci]
MANPLVSIIVPAYNVENYIEECVDSLLAQTYSPIEVIVLDDGSTDQTVKLLRSYEDTILLFENKENKGQGARRNQGMKIAKGKYLYFMDSDDWLEKDAIEKLVKQMSKTDADLVRFNGTVFYENSFETIQQEGRYDFSHQLVHQKVYAGDELLHKNRKSFSASPCLYLIKKEVIDTHGLFFLEGVLHEDEYFTARLFSVVEKMTYLNEAFYHRRYRDGSTMTKQSEEHQKRSFDSYLVVFCTLENDIQNLNLTTKQKRFLKRQLLSIYSGLIRNELSPEQEKKISGLSSISMKDKLFLRLASMKQSIERANR